MRLSTLFGFVSSLLFTAVAATAAPDPMWTYGLAQTRITPDKPLWMGGFAARTRPAEGTLDDLWVKALLLETPTGERGLLITADLVGFPKWLYDSLSHQIQLRHRLDRSRVLFAASHTHSGPVLRDALSDIYPLDDEQRKLIADYSQWLEKTILDTVDQAMASRKPATLWTGQGKATFAFNRRTNIEGDYPGMLQRGEVPKGPSDFAVPVLALRAPGGKLRAAVFGYAAHTSALTQNYRWSADYAGVARSALERNYPGSAALFFQGCGGDQSAVPRGTAERCQALGESLAIAVSAVLDKPMRPVDPSLKAAFSFVSLDFEAQPTRADLESLGRGTNYQARWARRLADELAGGREFSRRYTEYPVQVWKLGQDQLWIALGGEVCVDYALRFKGEFASNTWVTGYANDVMAYIPSRRLWQEGGYQAGAFEVYGLPATRWCPDIEDRIAQTVSRLVNQVGPEGTLNSASGKNR